MFAVFCGWAASAGALDQAPTPNDVPQRACTRCGKAAMAARMARAEAARMDRPPLDAAYLEAMPATDVLHYDLELELTNINTSAGSATITGSNVMTVQSKSPALTEFTFRLLNQFTITSAIINGSTPVVVATASPSTRVVTLDRAYGMDEVFDLTIAYTGTATSSGFGSFWVGTRFGNTEVSTLSEPYFAYTWWPCKDGDDGLPGDNSDKATFDFALTVPDTLTVPSNGLLQGVDDLTGNRKRYRWATNYPMVTYLLSFAASVYNTWTMTYNYPGGSMPVEIYAYPSQDTPSNHTAAAKIIDMLTGFRPLFGEYPFISEKYGIYNFAFGGGMEHQTMTGQGGFSEYLTAHELAHQWWGDMITCETWNHIWLNEGFASYAEALWAENKPGSTGFPALKSYMAGMKYAGPGSVYVTDTEVANWWNIFDGNTSYDKGAWVLHMLRRVLGDEEFYDALAAYRAAFAFGAATTEDFQAVCEGFYPGGDLGWFFQEWVYGERVPSYGWAWTTTVVNGKTYLLVYVDQTQNPTYQRFTMPIDIVAGGTTHVIFNDTDPEHFVLSVAAAPASVEFDPDEWVLRSGLTTVAYVAGPPVIVETSPQPGETLAFLDAIDSIDIYFQRDVIAEATQLALVGQNTGPKSFSIVSAPNSNQVTLSPSLPLPPDTYTLTVTDDVRDLVDGLRLDGEMSDPADAGSLPSGDGSAGGNAVMEFSVTAPFNLGDFDDDSDVDDDDFLSFSECYTGVDGGPIDPSCLPGDFDVNGSIDCIDWEQFTLVWTAGGGVPFFDPCDSFAAPTFDEHYKNRYLTFRPGPSGGLPQAFRVMTVSNPVFPETVGRLKWVGAPGASGVSRLQCDPEFRLWGFSSLDIADADVVPGATYAIEATLNGVDFLPSVTMLTVPVWGDVVGVFEGIEWTGPDNIVGIADFISVLDRFRSAPAAPPVSWCDLQPGIPDGSIDIIDGLYSIDAFRGLGYPFVAPSECP